MNEKDMEMDPDYPGFPYDSALGMDPVCNICGQPVVLGEYVRQTFYGMVIRTHPEETELGIKESFYMLVHTKCEKESD